MAMALGDFKTDFFGVKVVIMIMILRGVTLILWCEGGDNSNDVAMRVMGRLSSSSK